MSETLLRFFEHYPENKAPFLHKQLNEWKRSQPLKGFTVLHHVPLVPNTLLKIACLVNAGASVTVTNPNFMSAHPEAVEALCLANIPYVENISTLRGTDFDFYFDCGAELFQELGNPRKGAIELTASGDHYYRQQNLTFPVVSIDQTYTKQLETVFGVAESVNLAITKLINQPLRDKSWMIFGFGKIGRGLTYACVKNQAPVVVVDIDEKRRQSAESFGIKTIDPKNHIELQKKLSETDIVVTATGHSNSLKSFPKNWFDGKILANMGVLDEFGPEFQAHEVLNNKLPVNFVLDDPTPIQYIDPELYAHNIAVLELLNNDPFSGVTTLSKTTDQEIISSWCHYQNLPIEQVTSWFVK